MMDSKDTQLDLMKAFNRSEDKRYRTMGLYVQMAYFTGTDPVDSDTIDIPHEVVEDKQLPAHESQEHKP